MKEGMKILVGVDGSQHSEKAFEAALDLAEKYSASIVFVSVVPQIRRLGGRGGELTDAGDGFRMWTGRYPHPREELREYYKKVLSEALQKAKEIKPDLNVSTKLLEGQPASKIIETAKEGNFDLIVIGSRGLGSISAFFLGSVSHEVVNRAESQVLIIK